jgi:hypothetical protein
MNDSINLAGAWAALDVLVEDLGALAVSAVFLTGHGLVYVTSGPSGHTMSVNGERVPIGEPE